MTANDCHTIYRAYFFTKTAHQHVYSNTSLVESSRYFTYSSAFDNKAIVESRLRTGAQPTMCRGPVVYLLIFVVERNLAGMDAVVIAALLRTSANGAMQSNMTEPARRGAYLCEMTESGDGAVA